jgi:hypothetical protein
VPELFWRLVTFPLVLAGNEREALLRVADRLGAELGYTEDRELPGLDSDLGGEDGALVGILNPQDELLVGGIRRGLAKIAAALDGDDPGASESAVRAALDGTEMVIRGELVMGNGDQLPAMMPGFVFLVALPLVDQDRALEISQRAAELIEGALG